MNKKNRPLIINKKTHLVVQQIIKHVNDSAQTYEKILGITIERNQKNYKPQAYIFRKSRKRIEALFYQLCDQFMISWHYGQVL